MKDKPNRNRNRNLKISKALLKSQAHQGNSLFTSAATNQRVVKRSSGPSSRGPGGGSIHSFIQPFYKRPISYTARTERHQQIAGYIQHFRKSFIDFKAHAIYYEEARNNVAKSSGERRLKLQQ